MTNSKTRLHQSWLARGASALVRGVILPFWLKRDHPAYAKYRREYEATQFLSKEELQRLQLSRLRALLRHAFDHCPYYRQRMSEAGWHPDNVHSLEQISQLPLLTKRDIQDFGAQMQASNFPPQDRVRNQTGGSTGSPLQFYVDRERFDSRMASTHRHNLWAGMRPGDWQASLWGSRLDQGAPQNWWDRVRNELIYRTVSLNTSQISEGGWAGFLAQLRRKKPRVLVAYAQSAVLFARYLRRQSIEDIQFDAIITTAEVLLPGQRGFLEEVYGGRVFNRYGCREVSVIASECEYHRGMHVNAEALLVEIVPTADSNGGAGRIIVTDLLNFSMPLIRYEIGDVAAWAADQTCPCGRRLPLLEDVQGRITDFIALADGRKISGPALTLVVSDMADVRQVQFVQKALDRIVLRVVPGRNYGPGTEKELQRRLMQYLSPEISLAVEMAESIASEISGKYRFVVSELATDGRAEKNMESKEGAHARG